MTFASPFIDKEKNIKIVISPKKKNVDMCLQPSVTMLSATIFIPLDKDYI